MMIGSPSFPPLFTDVDGGDNGVMITLNGDGGGGDDGSCVTCAGGANHGITTGAGGGGGEDGFTSGGIVHVTEACGGRGGASIGPRGAMAPPIIHVMLYNYGYEEWL